MLVYHGVHQHGGSIMGKFAQNISTNIWSLKKRAWLKLREVFSILISYNITYLDFIHWMVFQFFWIASGLRGSVGQEQTRTVNVTFLKYVSPVFVITLSKLSVDPLGYHHMDRKFRWYWYDESHDKKLDQLLFVNWLQFVKCYFLMLVTS